MRLLWLTQNYYPRCGRMSKSCYLIVSGLRARGVNIDLAHFTRRLSHPTIKEQRNGRYLACPVGEDPAHVMNMLWNLLIKGDVFRVLLPTYSHVIAFGGLLPMLGAPVYAAWLSAPLITLIRGNDFDIAVFSPKRREILQAAMERSERVCTVSRDKSDKIRRLFPTASPVWIPNGLDLDDWRPLPSDRKKAEQWRLDTVEKDRCVLGMFGHIKQKKGGLFFLETLLNTGLAHHFHLLFVGEVEEKVLTWLENYQSQISYTVHPFVDRYALVPFYLACDMFVIASYYDGLPNVMLEAGALGIPLLASTAGGMGDFLEDRKHGFLFYPGDEHDCRAAIQRAANSNVEELRRMGKSCRTLVLSRLNHRIEVERYYELLSDIQQDQNPSTCKTVTDESASFYCHG